MGVNFNIKYKDRKKECYKDSTKEERAERLGNVICTRCGYQNHYFKKTLLRRLNNG